MPDSSHAANLEIRLAHECDAADIALVLRESFNEFRPLYTPEGFTATTPTAEQIVARWSEGPVWLAVRDGQIVGTVAAVPRGEVLYVRSMGVRPSERGRGTARRLLERVEEYARSRRHCELRLSTTPFLLAAIRLYERNGFAKTPEGPADLFGTPLFTMAKTL